MPEVDRFLTDELISVIRTAAAVISLTHVDRQKCQIDNLSKRLNFPYLEFCLHLPNLVVCICLRNLKNIIFIDAFIYKRRLQETNRTV